MNSYVTMFTEKAGYTGPLNGVKWCVLFLTQDIVVLNERGQIAYAV